MGIRLDWEIESEQQHVRQKVGEDPASRRRRHRRRLLILTIPVVLLLIVAVVAAAVVFRLRQVDEQIENVLRDTVDAEIATLRLGDEQSFLGFQRSATDAWLTTQQQTFDNYQARKVGGDIQLTGQILDVAIDHNRARVQVQEVLDGAPYVRTWFYWNYDDGWRHVPPDYTFWGDAATLKKDALMIRYQHVDEPLAQSLQETVTGWLQGGCAVLLCGPVPQVKIDIVAQPGLKTQWSADDPWLMQIPSPYTDLARADMPFDFALRFDVGTLLAERLVSVASGDLQPAYPADAYYLRSAIVSWLVGRFVGIDTNAFLIDSLARNYGDEAVGRLLQTMPPDASASVINLVTGTASLQAANLDWRDFLTWRLALEDELIARGDESSFLALYDTREGDVRAAAYNRFNAGEQAGQRTVTTITPETGPDGAFQLRATVETATGQTEALFRLVNGDWLRAN